jgi:hypothetical protein
MNLRAAPIACCLVLATGQAGAGPSSWDEVQLRLLQQHSTPLRWDNVEGAPYRVSGPKPHARFGQRLHLIQLQPGETVTLRAPESRWLRLVGEARTLSADDFEIGISADARMFAAASPLATSDPHSLLVELPPDKPSLVRLNRSLQAESNLVFAACFSREEPFNTFAPHREAVRLPGKSVRLRREGEILSHAARELDPGEELELSLKGPARLELVVTLRWPRNEPRREQSLVLQLVVEPRTGRPASHPRQSCDRVGFASDERFRRCAGGQPSPVSPGLRPGLSLPFSAVAFGLPAALAERAGHEHDGLGARPLGTGSRDLRRCNQVPVAHVGCP